MKTIHHYLKFATELDENNSTAKLLLSLPEERQIQMLNLMLKDLLVPALQPAIDELNAGNSYATLKLAN
jgi:hypothetical protein